MKIIDNIKVISKDMAKCILLGVYISLGILILMFLIGLIFRYNILELMYRGLFYVSGFILLITGLSFLRPDTLRPLDHIEEWENYFKKFNIGIVMLTIGITVFIAGSIMYSLSKVV